MYGGGAREHYSAFGKAAKELLSEVVLAIEEQRREYRIVVVPAPTGAEAVLILKRQVCIEVAPDGVDA